MRVNQRAASGAVPLLAAMGSPAAGADDFRPIDVPPGYTAAAMMRRRSVRALRPNVSMSPEVLAHVAKALHPGPSEPRLRLFVCAANVTGWVRGWYEVHQDGASTARSADPRLITPSWRNASGPSAQFAIAANLRGLDAPTYAALLVRAGRAAMNGWMVALDAGLEGAILAENTVRWWESSTGYGVVDARPLVSLSLSPAALTEGA
jgi:hypothetical protein